MPNSSGSRSRITLVLVLAAVLALPFALVVGLVATAYILGQYDSLLVYGLPAPFLRRVPVNAGA